MTGLETVRSRVLPSSTAGFCRAYLMRRSPLVVFIVKMSESSLGEVRYYRSRDGAGRSGLEAGCGLTLISSVNQSAEMMLAQHIQMGRS